MGLIVWIVLGLVVGLLARGIVPGRQRLNLTMTVLLGMAGSLLGGFVLSLVMGHPVTEFHRAGLVGSVVGAIVIMLLAGGVFTRRRLV